MPTSVPIVFLFRIWMFLPRVLVARHLQRLIFLDFQCCAGSWSLGSRLSCHSLCGLIDGSLNLVWESSGLSGWDIGGHLEMCINGGRALQAAVLIELQSMETEIERVQHLHFPLVVFLLILCIWKRQPYANCWLTIFPGMETIWIISMSFS